MKSFLRNRGGANNGRTSPTFQDDKPLTLSEDAVKRIYIPDGTFMTHHHAHQFLSFHAPSSLPEVVGTRTPQQQNRFFSSLLGTSSSFDDENSLLSNPHFEADPQNDKYNGSSSTVGSTPNPSRRRRQPQHRRGHAPRFTSSHFDPTLPAVGEGTATNVRDTGSKNNTSFILADLKGIVEEKDLAEPLVGISTRNKKRSRLKKMLAKVNCANCHRYSGGQKGDDGYSSGSSSGVKSNRSSEGDEVLNGRETPTSKGSDDAWEGPKYPEESSVISDSAPLLSSMLGSSSYTSLQPPLTPHQLIPQTESSKPILSRPTPFSRRLGKF